MRVRMRVKISGTRGGVDWPDPGGVLDCDDAEGAQLCRAGLAEPVVDLSAGEEHATQPATDEQRADTGDEPAAPALGQRPQHQRSSKKRR